MSDDLSTLPEDVQEAVSVADRWAGTYEHGFSAKNEWDTIRAELLRLARENAELHESAMGGYEDGWHALRNERGALRTELAKLKARIAEAPVAMLVHGNGDLLVAVSAEHPTDWAGKTVRLLVEEVDKREAKES